jgi:hypothetical protein
MDPHMDPEAWRVMFLWLAVFVTGVLLAVAAACGYGSWRLYRRFRGERRVALRYALRSRSVPSSDTAPDKSEAVIIS